MAKKVKKLDDVVKEETLKEQPIEESTEAIVEELPTNQTGEEVTKVEETTEAELPQVEFNEEIAPKSYSGLVQQPTRNDELKMKDGRIYKEIGNGLGMFLNDGTTFRI